MKETLTKTKIGRLIYEYNHYKHLAETLDGDDNATLLYYYYKKKMEEAQYQAYNLIISFEKYSLLNLIDM